LPSESLCRKLSKTSLTPSIENCEVLDGKISRKTGNSILEKVFPGGFLTMVGSNSPNAFSSIGYQVVVADEVDRFPISVGNEGSPIALIRNRQTTYPSSKLFCLSSPTIRETSIIHALYEDSDRRVYKVPCPNCSVHENIPDDGYFELKFEYLQYKKGKYDDVKMICPICCGEILEFQKSEMLAKGKWVAENPGHYRAGFRISSLYSPIGWVSWGDLARESDLSAKSPELRQVFINTKLGLPYEEKGEKIEINTILERAIIYPAEVPNRVRVLVLSVDVHNHFLEWLVQGWLTDGECYCIARGKIHGNTLGLTSDEEFFPTAWTELDKIRSREWEREDGYVMQIAGVYIDSGGTDSATDTVYRYCKKWANIRQRVVAIKGSSGSKDPIYSPKRWRKDKGCWYARIGTFEAKRVIFQTLQNETPGPGYYHFPSNKEAGFDLEAYDSLTSERLLISYNKLGKKVLHWVKEQGKRNEMLDLFVYNLYGILELNPDWEKIDKMYETRNLSNKPTTSVLRNETIRTPSVKKQRSVSFGF